MKDKEKLLNRIKDLEYKIKDQKLKHRKEMFDLEIGYIEKLQALFHEMGHKFKTGGYSRLKIIGTCRLIPEDIFGIYKKEKVGL